MKTKLFIAGGLAVGVVFGFMLAHVGYRAFAETTNIVDQTTLEGLYKAAFGRSLDSEASFHIGRDLNTVLNDINKSPEKRYYSALFKSVKSYEEAVRAPGQLSAEDKAKYLETIDSALATLIAWVETLPERPICNGVVRPEEAKEAIIEAYEGMGVTAKVAAGKSVFGSVVSVGAPNGLRLPNFRCLTTPTPKPTCLIRPACLDSTPRCLMPEPATGWCRKPVVACTEEAKICPDGTAVGRVGPNCDFVACPR